VAINRAPFNALIDDDGTNTVGSVWNKAAIEDVLLDPIDDALAAAGGVTLPISLTTDVTGTLQAAQEPAHTGDVTNAAGSLALTIGAGKVTNAMLAGSIDQSKLTGSIPASKVLPATGWLLTDGATVGLDAGTRSSYYRLNAAGDRTISAPTNPADGQKIVIVHLASGGARTLTLAGGTGGFRFGSDIPALTATASGKIDYIGCIYDIFANKWDVVAVTKAF
jgi:hypothetical protein